jgi:hypothetical protein
VDQKPLKARVGAVSPVLFKGGEGCGACYKVIDECKDPDHVFFLVFAKLLFIHGNRRLSAWIKAYALRNL